MSKTRKIRRMRKRDESAKAILAQAKELVSRAQIDRDCAQLSRARAQETERKLQRQMNYLVEAAKQSKNHMVKFIAGDETVIDLTTRLPKASVAVTDITGSPRVAHLDVVSIMESVDDDMAVVRLSFGDKTTALAMNKEALLAFEKDKSYLVEQLLDTLITEVKSCSVKRTF